MKSSKTDTNEDRAVVATWLTRLESPWEAALTYVFALNDEDTADCQKDLQEALAATPTRDLYDAAIISKYLAKYVTRIYGGNLKTRIVADAEYLCRFHFQFLDAISCDRVMISVQSQNPFKLQS